MRTIVLALVAWLALACFGPAVAATDAASAPAAPIASAAAAASAASTRSTILLAQASPEPGGAATPAPAAAAAAPVPNKGDTAWMIVATAFVILMTVPGLALFYGGLVRSKNMLSILMQVFVIFSLIVVLWMIYGYSFAFTEGNAFVGGTDRLFLKGIFDFSKGSFATAATFSKGVVLPEYIYVAFEATFAAITVGLVVGAFAERMKFSAVLLFSVLWFTFAYIPIAHMVWYWPGPDGITNAATLASETAKGGYLWQTRRARFRRRHRRPHQRRHRGPRRRVLRRQADRPRPRVDGAAQPDDDDDRRVAAVGRLVRLQRGLGARGGRHRGARVRQHAGRDGRRRAVVDLRRVAAEGQAVDARRRLGRGRRPRRRSRRRAATSDRSARSCSGCSPASSACGACRG